jgi:hypothetical protein
MLKKIFRCAIFVLLILVLLVSVFAVVLKFWVGPNIARQRMHSIISKTWAGQVQIEDVEFNLFKPLKYKNVSFLDSSRRQWAHAETFEVVIEDWPSMEAKIEAIKLDSLELQFHLENPALNELFNIAEKEPQEVKKKLKLPTSTVDNVSIYITDGNGPTLVWGNLSFSSKQNEELYEFSVVSKEPKEKERLAASGGINLESLESDVSVEFEHTFRQEENVSLIKLFSGTEDYRGGGHVAANLKISGLLNEPNSLPPQGSVEITDWSASYKELESVVKEMDCEILLAENNINCERFSAVIYGGIAEGDFNIDYGRAEPAEFSGKIVVKELQLAEVAKNFERLGKVGKGTADAEFVFSATKGEPNGLKGHGYIQLNDSDLYSAPITSYIFSTIGLKDQHLTRMADGVCVFSINGRIITIQEAEATSEYGAIVAEPGGTIDLEKNWIDVYVIALQVRAIRELLNKIPFMSIITKPTDKLRRFRIEGNMSEPPNKLVKKQAIRDVTEGTVSFFKEVINAGGELTDKTVNSSRSLFDTLTKNNGGK